MVVVVPDPDLVNVPALMKVLAPVLKFIDWVADAVQMPLLFTVAPVRDRSPVPLQLTIPLLFNVRVARMREEKLERFSVPVIVVVPVPAIVPPVHVLDGPVIVTVPVP